MLSVTADWINVDRSVTVDFIRVGRPHLIFKHGVTGPDLVEGHCFLHFFFFYCFFKSFLYLDNGYFNFCTFFFVYVYNFGHNNVGEFSVNALIGSNNAIWSNELFGEKVVVAIPVEFLRFNGLSNGRRLEFVYLIGQVINDTFLHRKRISPRKLFLAW